LVNLLIPPPRFARCSGRGAKLTHAAASCDFNFGIFRCKLVRAGSYNASKKSHFRRVTPIVSPFRPLSPIIPSPRPRAPPPNDLRRRAWGRLCHTVPGVVLLFLFLQRGSDKKIIIDARHFPLPCPSILIIPPLCPRALSRRTSTTMTMATTMAADIDDDDDEGNNASFTTCDKGDNHNCDDGKDA
jgi:hypothetical protein